MEEIVGILSRTIAIWGLKVALVEWVKHFLLSGLAGLSAYLLTSTISLRGGLFTRFWRWSLVWSFSVLAHILLDYVK